MAEEKKITDENRINIYQLSDSISKVTHYTLNEVKQALVGDVESLLSETVVQTSPLSAAELLKDKDYLETEVHKLLTAISKFMYKYDHMDDRATPMTSAAIVKHLYNYIEKFRDEVDNIAY